ncbi:hypothetical protein EVAR_19083_1 [Eumeta japonica]|uniref:Uncharacterized protein n=1 Tax=Eumeta variegata TaxID=151549 RepID=A0A4C1UP79_EUMVA|nr:hypothetical protein EVAR_19083_1 [Eumeta japonica]
MRRRPRPRFKIPPFKRYFIDAVGDEENVSEKSIWRMLKAHRVAVIKSYQSFRIASDIAHLAVVHVFRIHFFFRSTLLKHRRTYGKPRVVWRNIHTGRGCVPALTFEIDL